MFIHASYNKLSPFIRKHFKSLFPFLTFYKTCNILFSLSEMSIGKIKCISKPFIYRIDPCSLCNLQCPSCSSNLTNVTEKRMMDFDDYKKIIDKIQNVAIRASLYDSGEPLLNKNIYRMIGYAGSKRISTLISTNFNLFGKGSLESLFRSNLTVLEPCLDGFTQEKYAEYRKGGNVETVKNGIKMVMEHKNSINAKWPIVDVQIILFDHLKDEISNIDSFLKECHVDKITYRADYRGIANKGNSNNSTCYWLYIGMTIRPDGNVYPCCGNGFNRFSYGNLLKQDLDEIWNNKYYRFSRALFQKGPELDYDEEMDAIPCIRCKQFKIQRKIKKMIVHD